VVTLPRPPKASGPRLLDRFATRVADYLRATAPTPTSMTGLMAAPAGALAAPIKEVAGVA
jgi:hypothetical protein